MTIIQKFQSRVVRFRKKRNELLYLKNAGINDEIIEDIRKCKQEILKALDEEKEQWILLRDTENNPHIKEWINNIIKGRYE